MSTSSEPGDQFVRNIHDEDQPDGEDIPTRLTRGVVDGFTEASEAFSRELEGTNRFPDLMGRSVAGVIRANARLLDEVATLVRQTSDGLSVRSGRPTGNTHDELDYERLADLVAARLAAAGASTPEPGGGSAGRGRKA